LSGATLVGLADASSRNRESLFCGYRRQFGAFGLISENGE
jgi:hypothetical protein